MVWFSTRLAKTLPGTSFPLFVYGQTLQCLFMALCAPPNLVLTTGEDGCNGRAVRHVRAAEILTRSARYPALFSPATNTMQLFMWQRDIVGVAHYIMDCFWCAWCP